jgi:hypothetical protein
MIRLVPGESVQDPGDRARQAPSFLTTVFRPLESADESVLAALKRGKVHGFLLPAKGPARGQSVPEPLLDTSLLWQQCGSIGAQLEKQQWSTKITVGAGVALTAGLSAGYVILLFRGGSLLATALASLPAWRTMDPLPVIEYWERDGKRRRLGRKPEKAESPDQSLESLVK